jgi:hypothetical protein
LVVQEISRRWGGEAARQYDPTKNCFTYAGWLDRGYVVRKGEKSIRSIVIIEKTNEAGEIVKKPRVVNLFSIQQVEKLPAFAA